MFESFGAVCLPLMAAMMHPFLGRFIQRGNKEGVSLSVIVGIANVVTGVIFLLYLSSDWSAPWSALDTLAVGNGVMFFLGQYFSIKSMKVGDIVVHSSAMGVKILVVAVFALMVGLEVDRPYLLPASVLACISVFMVAGGNLQGWREHRLTVWLTVMACLFFGLNDFLTGWKAQDIGSGRWLTLMMSSAAVMSLSLLVGRISEVKEMSLKQGKWVILVGLTLGVQALLVNIAFSHFQEPTLSNVAYSSRGIMAVIFLWVIGERNRKAGLSKQLLGAVIMIAALGLALLK